MRFGTFSYIIKKVFGAEGGRHRGRRVRKQDRRRQVPEQKSQKAGQKQEGAEAEAAGAGTGGTDGPAVV